MNQGRYGALTMALLASGCNVFEFPDPVGPSKPYCNVGMEEPELPDGVVSQAYSAELKVYRVKVGLPCDNYEQRRVTWRVERGQLPVGIVLNPDTGNARTARLEGVPSLAGRFDFTIRASEDISARPGSEQTTRTLSITILETEGP